MWLVCGLRCAETLAVVTRLIEAANTLLTGRKHVTSIAYPALPGLGLLGRVDPVNPVEARDRCSHLPTSLGLRRGNKSFSQIIWQLRFRLWVGWCDLNGYSFTNIHANSFAQLPTHLEPVAKLPIWVERCLK